MSSASKLPKVEQVRLRLEGFQLSSVTGYTEYWKRESDGVHVEAHYGFRQLRYFRRGMYGKANAVVQDFISECRICPGDTMKPYQIHGQRWRDDERIKDPTK